SCAWETTFRRCSRSPTPMGIDSGWSSDPRRNAATRSLAATAKSRIVSTRHSVTFRGCLDRANPMTNPAKPRDPRAGQRQQGPAPSPPPRWWGMLFYLGLALTLLLFLLPTGKAATQLSYTQFLDKVNADQVKTATIDPNGSVSGTLSNGTKYSAEIPVALQDTNLGQLLRD